MKATYLLALLLAAAASAADSTEIRLDRQLGRPAGVVLRGITPTEAVPFTLPRGRQISAGRLEVSLRASTSLTAGSSFTVGINGMPLRSVRLGPGASSEVSIDASIPLEILRDYNQLEFRAELHNSLGHPGERCESPTDPALWLAIAASSRLSFEIGGYTRAPAIADFPVPLADPLDYRPARIRVVLTPQHDSADYGLAVRLAGMLGDRLEYRLAAISAVTEFDPAADAAQVLIGTPEQIAAWTGRTPEGGLSTIENPGRSGQYLWIVAGSDSNERRKLVDAIPESARPRGLLPEAETFLLSEIGGAVTVRGADPPPIVIPLRPASGQHFVRAEQHVHLEYAYGPQVDTSTSALELTLNGKAIHGQALERAAGSAAEVLDVLLPTELMGEENRLELRFHLFPKNAGTCQGAGPASSGNHLWATLLDRSSFHLPRDSYADLPDLTLLRSGGFPLRGGPTIIVARQGDATLLLNAAFLLGRLWGATPWEVHFDTEMTAELRRANHLIVIGESAGSLALSIEEALSPWNPQRLLLTVLGSPESAAQLQQPELIARLAGTKLTADAAGRLQTITAARTERFGEIPVNRRVKYWVMDNVPWLILNSIASLFVGFFLLRYLRKNHFPPLPDPGIDNSR